MNCAKCGFEYAEGSLFCRQCGAPLNAAENAPQEEPSHTPEQQPQEPPQAYTEPQTPVYQQPPAPPQTQAYGQPIAPTPQAYGQPPYPPQAPPPGYQTPYAPPPKKKTKTGLIIGLVAGGVALVAAAVLLYLFVLSGTPVQGEWYCAERGWVLSFGNEGEVEMHSLSGAAKNTYEYDKGKAQGKFTADETQYMFKIKDSRLALSDGSSQAVFTKLSGNEPIEPLVLAALEGYWTSEEIGEVLMLDDGDVYVYSGYGDFKGSYKYDMAKGGGVFTLNSGNYAFSATHTILDVPDTGTYVKAPADLDIAAFMSEFGSPLIGTWYDLSGEYGTITFYEDGTAEILSYGETFTSEYTYLTAEGTGTITMGDAVYTFVLSGGILTIDDVSYSRDYVAQASADALGAILGVWNEAAGMYGSVNFNADGSAQVYMHGITYFGTYNYDSLTGNGEMTIDFLDGALMPNAFMLDGQTLNIEGMAYTREYVPEVIHIAGTWYDINGETGTLYFDEHGGLYMDTYGTYLMGTYAFDAQTLSGTLTIQFDDAPITVDLYLADGLLSVDDLHYTRSYVAQPYYEEPMAG